MKRSEFVIDYEFHKLNMNCGGSYIDFLIG